MNDEDDPSYGIVFGIAFSAMVFALLWLAWVASH
jgi:hypothetical protein